MAALWLGAGIAVGLGGLYAFTVGFGFGLFVHWHCSVAYKRAADDAYRLAYAKAYEDHLAKLDDEKRRKEEIEAHPLTQDRDDADASFESSLEALYPGDSKIKEKLKADRQNRVDGR